MAEPLILLPGLAADLRQWQAQLLEFGRERPVTVAPVWLGERIEEIASAILPHLPQRFALAGTGFGGMVAMEMLRRAPERVQRLALIATSPLADTPAEAAARERQIVAARSGRLEEALTQAIPAAALGAGPGRVTVRKLMEEMARAHGAEVFVRQVRALQRRRDQQSVLRRCRAPVALVCGAQDTVTPERRHAFMAELIPAARLTVIAEAGHLPTMETPEAVTAALRDWLAAPLVLR